MTETPAAVLVVDDEAKIRELVRRALEGREVLTAGSAAEARTHLPQAAVVLLDLRLGDTDGLDLLDEILRERPNLAVIIMTSYASVENAVAAMRRGARDYLAKPFASLDELRLAVDRALGESQLQRENAQLRELLIEQDRFEAMIGESPPMQKLYALIERAAVSEATVLVTGESGSGKELVARALHRRGPRRSGPFVDLNCAAIPATLLESELFGHEKGAFTGAVRTRQGLFEAANGGTIFLDEIGDLSLDLQVKLLRVIEEKRVTRLGGNTARQLDLRVIAATHRDLQRAVAEGVFREDLYYRLAVILVPVPPLRERGEDILRIFRALAPRAELAPEAAPRLLAYPWPGNIRELKNFAERLASLGVTRVTPEVIEQQLIMNLSRPADRKTADEDATPLDERLASFERELIRAAMTREDGVRSRAAKRLGISRQLLQYKLEKHGL